MVGLDVRNCLLNGISAGQFCVDNLIDGTQCMEWNLNGAKCREK